MLDYPTAWRIVKQTDSDQHHEKCSFRQAKGGILCDCAVVTAIRIARDELIERAETAERQIAAIRTLCEASDPDEVIDEILGVLAGRLDAPPSEPTRYALNRDGSYAKPNEPVK